VKNSMPPLHPWIQEYLINIAEQYGVDYFNAPPHEKSRTVQIIEVLVSNDTALNIFNAALLVSAPGLGRTG